MDRERLVFTLISFFAGFIAGLLVKHREDEE